MGELDFFSTRIKDSRESLGMTQKEFSEHVGIKQQTLSGYERGIMKSPLDIVKGIAEKCNISIDWLCGLSDRVTINEYKEGSQTYSDIIKTLFEFEKTGMLNELIQSGSYESEPEFVSLEFKDTDLKFFIMQWSRMKYVLKEGLVDETAYEDWKTGIIEKYSKLELVTKGQKE